MAISEKTLVFAVPTTTTLTLDNAFLDLDQITIYIPEFAPTIVSAYAEIGFQDVASTGSTINRHAFGFRLGAATYDYPLDDYGDIRASGENIAGVIGPIDLKGHFDVNWSGSSMTFDCRVLFRQETATTMGMANVTVKIYITYEYDDTATTQAKTVRIPMHSYGAALPNVQSEMRDTGNNQIPQLTGAGGFLPENGVVIRDWFVVFEGNEGNNGSTTDWTLKVAVDGGTAYDFQVQSAGLASDRFCRWIWRPGTIPATGSAHSLDVWCDQAGKGHCITATLYVTYEFTLAGTTRVINSLLLPWQVSSPLGANVMSWQNRYVRDIECLEPGTLTLKQSAVRINYNNPSSANLILNVGSQGQTAYQPEATVNCGMGSVQHRIDAGGFTGLGIDSFGRGRNQLVMDIWGASTSANYSNISGNIILNYESDLSADGIGKHATSCLKIFYGWDTGLYTHRRFDGWFVPIALPDYYLVSAGFTGVFWGSSAATAITFDVQANAGEAKGGGYYDIYADAYQGDSERACTLLNMQARSAYKRFNEDAGKDRVDLEVGRKYRFYVPTSSASALASNVTVHGHTWTVAGNLTDNDPALPTQLRLINEETGEFMQEQTLSAGTTAFSFQVYSNVDLYTVSAYQDGTHVGRSAPGTAS